MSKTSAEVIEEIFDRAGRDEEVGDLAPRLQTLWQSDRWTAEDIARVSREKADGEAAKA